MDKTSFWKTKAGALTIGFILAMLSFVIILIGIKINSETIENLGLVIVIVAVLISPIKVFILDKKSK
jgi:hypothetical protein|nr:hypothetical protein [uncultured Mogibacterium sp.]